jgi:hypothetical protein
MGIAQHGLSLFETLFIQGAGLVVFTLIVRTVIARDIKLVALPNCSSNSGCRAGDDVPFACMDLK